MTNEELTTGLKHIAHTMERNGHSYYQHIAENAIKALEQQPCKDCVSRVDVKEQMLKYGFNAPDMTVTEFVEDCLQPVTPQTVTEFADKCKECGKIQNELAEDCISREAVEKITWEEPSYTDALNVLTEVREKIRQLPPVKPKYTDEEIDKAQAVEQAYVDKMVELAIEETKRPKGKWIEVEVHNCHATLKCSVCDRVIEPTFTFGEYSYEDIKTFYPYCHCGAEMSGDAEMSGGGEE